MFYLVNDASTGSTRVAPGSTDTAENGQCSLAGSGSTAITSGSNITLYVNVTFKQSFAGTKNIYLFSQDVEGLHTGFPIMGTWTVPPFTNQPPVNVSLVPAAAAGSSQVFQLRFTDPNGYGDLVSPEFLMNASLDTLNSCTVLFDKLNGAVLLLNDAATVGTPVLLNSSQSAQNSQCTLLGQGSLATGAGNDLVLQLNLVFKPAFRGARNIYMYTRDQAGQNSGVELKGSYTVQ